MPISITGFDAQQPVVMYCLSCYEILSCPSVFLPRSRTNVSTSALEREHVRHFAAVCFLLPSTNDMVQHSFGRARAMHPSCSRNSPPASHVSQFRPVSTSTIHDFATHHTCRPPPSSLVHPRTHSHRHGRARPRVPPPTFPRPRRSRSLPTLPRKNSLLLVHPGGGVVPSYDPVPSHG